jgi:hypothetical protein
MLTISTAAMSLAHGLKVPGQAARAPVVNMKGSELVLSDKEVEAKIMAVVNAEPGKTKGAAMCSQIMSANLAVVRDEDSDRGCAPNGPPFTVPTGIGWDVSTEPKNTEDMKALAMKLNPVVGFWDPLDIVNENTAPETIGWFRHAEIKHGRVAMAGFVGYLVHAAGIHFPWNIQAPIAQSSITADLPTISFGDISAAGAPGDMWDALPTAAKVQIGCVIGFLEMHGENSIPSSATARSTTCAAASPATTRPSRAATPTPCPSTSGTPSASPRSSRLSARRRLSSPRSIMAAWR